MEYMKHIQISAILKNGIYAHIDNIAPVQYCLSQHCLVFRGSKSIESMYCSAHYKDISKIRHTVGNFVVMHNTPGPNSQLE